MKKSISVQTDDPKRPWTTLTMAGKVNAFAVVAPRYARLNGKVGTAVQAIVRITPTEAYPFKITDVKAKKGRYIAYALSEPSEKTEGAYLLTVTNTRKEAGRYADTLTLTTDSKVRKTLKVGVYGYISDPSKKSVQKPAVTKKPVATKSDG